jgi:hypothetical protein
VHLIAVRVSANRQQREERSGQDSVDSHNISKSRVTFRAAGYIAAAALRILRRLIAERKSLAAA